MKLITMPVIVFILAAIVTGTQNQNPNTRKQTMKVVKIHENAVLPKLTEGNLGFDLHVVPGEGWVTMGDYGKAGEPFYVLSPGERRTFNTGLKMAIPYGYGVFLKDRSGNAAKMGIHVLAGVIDQDYRGEWKICLLNTGNIPFLINSGDRIAQGVFVLRHEVTFEEVESLDETTRGEDGFGSSGS